MKKPLKIFLFVTAPIWILPMAFKEIIVLWYQEFSEWLDEWGKEKNT